VSEPHFLCAKILRSCRRMNSKPDQNISDRWVQHQRKHTKTTQNWACILCPDRRIFATETALWEHAKTEHVEQLDSRKDDLLVFKEEYTTESAQKRCVALSQGRQQNWPPKFHSLVRALDRFKYFFPHSGRAAKLTPDLLDRRRTTRSLASP
jgi:hypothetical protein